MVKDTEREPHEDSDHTGRKQFVVRPRKITFHAGLNYDKTEAILESLEGPEHK